MKPTSKTIAIMQPYIFPYIGYFQLINAVNEFIIYDNIQYTKKGWINRNRILVNGKPEYVSIPLKKGSSYFDVNQRFISESFDKEKMLRKLQSVYVKSPFIDKVFPIIEKIIFYEEQNLFKFIFNSLDIICNYLGIKTKIIKSSSIKINHDLKSESKVKEICKYLKSDIYINPIGGLELYKKENFTKEGIELFFLKPNLEEYDQFEGVEFVPGLSIIDIMMFNSPEQIKTMLNQYTLI